MCRKLGLQTNGIGFLPSQGQYSQFWELQGCEKMVPHPTRLGSSLEEPNTQHSPLSPEGTSVSV